MMKKPARPKGHREATTETLAQAFAKHGHGLTDQQLAQTRAPLRHLYTAPAVFQPRESSTESPWTASHVRTLASAANRETHLAPITVFAIAGTRYIVDGHCRYEAYKQAGKRPSDSVPVRYLRGTFHEALLVSAAGNSKDKLPLTLSEKLEAAWRMVQHNHRHKCYSVRKIAEAASVSVGTVHGMQKRLATIIAAGTDFDSIKSWRQILYDTEHERGDWTDEKENELRARYKTKLHKAFGKLDSASKLNLALEALHEAYPRLWEIMHEAVAAEREDDQLASVTVDSAWDAADDF